MIAALAPAPPTVVVSGKGDYGATMVYLDVPHARAAAYLRLSPQAPLLCRLEFSNVRDETCNDGFCACKMSCSMVLVATKGAVHFGAATRGAGAASDAFQLLVTAPLAGESFKCTFAPCSSSSTSSWLPWRYTRRSKHVDDIAPTVIYVTLSLYETIEMSRSECRGWRWPLSYRGLSGNGWRARTCRIGVLLCT